MLRLVPILMSSLAVLLVSCSEGKPSIQDLAFIQKIKATLKVTGDEILVKDLHAGDWKSVCINPLGAYSNIEVKHVKGEGLRPNGVVVNNTKDTYASDLKWGIYFVNQNDSVDYYNIPASELVGGAPDGCIDRETAIFVVRGDIKKNNNGKLPTVHVAKDLIYIDLVSK